MKALSRAAALLLLGSCSPAAAEGSPLAKVLDLMDGLAAKVKHEGEEEAKAFKEYQAWCTDKIRSTGFEIETSTAQQAKLEAKINALTADIQVATSKIESLASAVASNSNQLKEATAIRDRELADYVAAEKELGTVIDSLARAHTILQREMKKAGGSFAQMDTTNQKKALQLLNVVVEAAAFSIEDRTKLLALVQAQDSSEADQYITGAPAAAAYTSHSSSILDLIEDLKDKAEEQLSTLRKTESNAQHSYALLKQSLETQTDADSKDLNQQKSDKSAAEEGKANAEGDLEMTKRELQNAQETLASTKANCDQIARDHEETVKSREEELKVIAEAKDILSSTTSGAVEEAYSFLQLGASSSSQAQSRVERTKSEVLGMVQRLARKHHSAALAQLASRISAVARFGAGAGQDPFAKIKALIQDLISKLQAEAQSDATEKAYCDDEMKKTKAKKDELGDKVAKLTGKLDQATSRAAELKGQIAELQQELATLAKEQAEMDKIRQESHAAYVKAKADLELGLTGVRKVLNVLREYYGGAAFLQGEAQAEAQEASEQPAAPEKHSKSGGAGAGIIGILEVVESDFSKNLVKEETQEADAQSEYEKTTQQNKITTASKNQDVNYKTQESKSLETTIVELSTDRDSTSAELDAVLEYWSKLQERCVAKPESYEERAARRQAEISGLKQALETLQSETAFAQRSHRSRRFRGKLEAQ